MSINDTRLVNVPGSRYIDINKILQFSNWGIFFASVIYLLCSGFPSVLDGWSLLLQGLLALETGFFLHSEKSKRNPLVLILCLITIVFISSRILTVSLHDIYSFSNVLNRLKPTNPEDTNFALFFLILANFAIYFGITVEKFPCNGFEAHSYRESNSLKIKISTVFILATFLAMAKPAETVGVLELLFYLVSPFNILLISSVFLCISDNSNKLCYASRFLLISTLFYLTMLTFSGSRAGVVIFLQTLLYAMFAAGIYRVKLKVIYTSFLLLIFGILLFPTVTYMRSLGFESGDLTLVDKIKLADEFVSNIDYGSDYSQAIIPALDRAAFLDPVIDLIKNNKEYAVAINVEDGIKSIVDAGFTPGFDIFNVSKLSNRLSAIYYDQPERLLRDSELPYQSDQLSVYGEYYVLFAGLFSLPVFYFISVVFCKLYKRAERFSGYNKVIFKSFVLSVFYNWIISYGFDWIVVYSILDLISLCIFIKLIGVK